MRLKKIMGFLYRIVVVALLLIVFFQPWIESPFIIFIYENIVWLILLLTTAGIFFMFFRNTGLIYFSMISAAALTMYVKDISNQNLVYTEQDKSSKVFSLHQYNCSRVNGDYEKLIGYIKENGSDIISIVGVSPTAAELWHDELSDQYPVIAELNDENDRVKLIFSKFEISSIDTLDLGGNHQFNIEYSIYGIPVNIIFSCIHPPDQPGENLATENQIKVLAEKANRIKYKPLLVIGNFNQVYWSREMRNFMYLTKLNNARRFVNAVSNRNPHNHVFYSNYINCLSFVDVYDGSSNAIGIRGSFEIIKPEVSFYTENLSGDLKKNFIAKE